MAASTLVEQDITDGERVVKALDKSGLQVQSAFWYYYPETDKWLLFIATPTVDEEGPTGTYSRVQRTLAKISPEPALSLKDISVVSPNHELVQLLRTAIRTGPGTSHVRFSRNTINGVFIADALLYRVQ